jgi:hypothetical protein
MPEPPRGRVRLGNAFIVQRDVGPALKQALGVPIGDAVPRLRKERGGAATGLISTCW